MSLSSRDRDLEATGPKLFWWLWVTLGPCYAHLGWERKVSCLTPPFLHQCQRLALLWFSVHCPLWLPTLSYASGIFAPCPLLPCCPLRQTLNEPHICSCVLLFSHPVKHCRVRPKPPVDTHGPSKKTFPSGLTNSPPQRLPGSLPPLLQKALIPFLPVHLTHCPQKPRLM